MPSVLICSHKDTWASLGPTLLGRDGIDRFKAGRLEDAQLLAKTTRPGAGAAGPRPAEGARFPGDVPRGARDAQGSIACSPTATSSRAELELLELGANAILRLPPDVRLGRSACRSCSRCRCGRRRTADTAGGAAEADGDRRHAGPEPSMNGMLVESTVPLTLYQELSFRFKLPDGSHVSGGAAAVRQAAREPVRRGVREARQREQGRDRRLRPLGRRRIAATGGAS